MSLVTQEDIIRAAPILKYPGGKHIASLLFKMMKLDIINSFYEQNLELSADEFIEAAINALGFHYHIANEEFQNIPKDGPFITISNHAYGGIDGMILVKVLPAIRPDFKVMMNFLLARVKPIEGIGLRVNPFEQMPNVQSSYGGLREALSHLKEGHPLGIFPAGEVASFNLISGGISEKIWPYSILKLIKKARVPIVPVYFNGHNSVFFNIIGLIHPLLRTACLPSELFNKSRKDILVRIGRPISVRDQDKLKDINDFGRYLRMRTLSLGIKLEKQRRIWHLTSCHPQSIIQPVAINQICDEIEKLTPSHLLFSLSEYSVFCAPFGQIPNIMTEIGRLREISYREVGEGTFNPCDLDEFDQYYDQLFIWNNLEKKIIGGYRVGYGNHIIEKLGIKGFYINTLFHVKAGFTPVLKLSVELGRSFIVKAYQKTPLPLFLLWKGLFQLVFRNPEFRYLIGPVSISNKYSQLSKSLTVEFLKKYYFNREFASYLNPRKKFVPEINGVIKKRIFHEVAGKSISGLDNFIQAFDPVFEIPVLIKKYLSINSEVIGFNVDPQFNNCLDVLIITDIHDIPMETLKSLSKEVDGDEVKKRFNQTKIKVEL